MSGVNPAQPLLEVDDLSVHFPIQQGLLKRVVGQVKAVDELDLTVLPRETVGLVGESGCGKTTVGRTLLRIYEPTAGDIWFRMRSGERVHVPKADAAGLKAVRREMRMIFQDPHSSLNPRLPVGEIVGQPLTVNGIANGSELQDRVAELMRKVGLRPEHMRRYPHAFSGGQRQRIGIARALALNPSFIVCDESVSALDVSVQAQVLNLLLDLQDSMGLTYLFISHDLAVVQHVSDRIAVMYAGRIVETGPSRALFAMPRHPYTEALLSAAPRPDPKLRDSSDRILLNSDVADAANLPTGCSFNPRCRYATNLCRVERPPVRPIGHDGQAAACHYADTLHLRGVATTAAA